MSYQNSSMICQIDKYVTYQYNLFANALDGTEGETQEIDCLVEHLIGLNKLPKGLASLVVTPNHPNCTAINEKLYGSFRESFKPKPTTSLFAMPPSKTYELCILNRTTKEHSNIMQFVFKYLPHQQIDEQQKRQIKNALEDSMKTFAKIHFECLKHY